MITIEKAIVKKKVEEVEIAIRILCFLYPKAGSLDQPNSAGVVLRRFQLRERDLLQLLETEE